MRLTAWLCSDSPAVLLPVFWLSDSTYSFQLVSTVWQCSDSPTVLLAAFWQYQPKQRHDYNNNDKTLWFYNSPLKSVNLDQLFDKITPQHDDNNVESCDDEDDYEYRNIVNSHSHQFQWQQQMTKAEIRRTYLLNCLELFKDICQEKLTIEIRLTIKRYSDELNSMDKRENPTNIPQYVSMRTLERKH